MAPDILPPAHPLSYDAIAPVYDQRYRSGPTGVYTILRSLARRVEARSVLEAGCGTGHWLSGLHECEKRYGLDLSFAMLGKASQKKEALALIRGRAGHLPFADSSFDFVYCVHAIHHFSSSTAFINEARRVLKPGGALATIGMDPFLQEDHWYVYHYFDKTLQTDRQRYSSTDALITQMLQAGFVDVHCSQRARLDYDFQGCEVFTDPILQKNGASQLTLLTDEDFSRGMASIRQAIRSAERDGEKIVFAAHISLPAVYGFVPSR